MKTQKAIIRDFLDGTNRPKVKRWTPKWLAFPAAAYSDRPFATLAKWEAVAPVIKALPSIETDAAVAMPLAAE